MTDPIRILVHGAGGRMGRAVLDAARERSGLTVVATVSRSALDGGDVPHYTADALDAVPAFDVAVDFSLPDGFDRVLALCVARGAALVSGTTGLDAAQRGALDAAAQRIPLAWASNFSIGVAVLDALVERASALLADWDCEIVETHHRRKLDAPSGTALTLADAVARGRDAPSAWIDRIGTPGARAPGSVGIASLRGGGVIGEHTVALFGSGERIELVHRAEDRSIFARGAVRAAMGIAGRAPGRYRVAELLGTR